MSKTIQTIGWEKPKGNCDICNKRKAAYWFGDTSVALCGDQECSQINQERWDRMCREMEEEEEQRRNW